MQLQVFSPGPVELAVHFPARLAQEVPTLFPLQPPVLELEQSYACAKREGEPPNGLMSFEKNTIAVTINHLILTKEMVVLCNCGVKEPAG